jgi:hypothetical protein
MSEQGRKIVWLSLYAIAMAQVEASLVIHLRTIYSAEPLEIFPLSLFTTRDLIMELVRELATLVMILSVALLSARGFTRVFAAFVFVFGLWDLFYYLWLKIMMGWPLSWMEWDVLFLLPWIWLGPWLTPALIALLFVVWGGWVLYSPREIRFARNNAVLFVLGVLLALAAFLQPAAFVLWEGKAALQGFQPEGFWWFLFLLGYLLMVVGLWRTTRKNNTG